jgi:hypothetical protein
MSNAFVHTGNTHTNKKKAIMYYASFHLLQTDPVTICNPKS